jgi:hypothetical protein
MSTSDRINREATKDPAQLEREIDQQRADISHTLSALEQKFTPGELFDKVIGYARGGGSEFIGNLTDTVRANPVPTVLTAVGLVWLMSAQRQPAAYRYADTHSDSPSLGDRASHLGASLSQGKDAARRRLHDGTHRLSEGAHRLSESAHHSADMARQQALRARQGLSHMLEEQPLAVGALGIALGALIGASLPATRREDELLGRSSDQLKQQARQAVHTEAEQLRSSLNREDSMSVDPGGVGSDSLPTGANLSSNGQARGSSRPPMQ